MMTPLQGGVAVSNNINNTQLQDGSITATQDGAKGQCAQIDPTSPSRAICKSCYDQILTQRCPGKTDFSQCIDPAIASTYNNLVNQCISQSVIAGFTCTTTCSGGLTLNPNTCQCQLSTSTISGSSGGSSSIDTGRVNFGPPIVGLVWPANTIGVADPAGSVCKLKGSTNALPISLGFFVQNRGDTVFRLNQYATPTASSASCASSLSAPVTINSSTAIQSIGANVFTSFQFSSSGSTSVTNATGGNVGWIKHYSGTGAQVNGSSGNTGSASSAGWQTPAFGTRDKYGNIFFSDTAANIVRVICTDVASAPNIFCNGLTAGNIYIVAGQAATSGMITDDTVATAATLATPQGLAVDSNDNLYIADSTNQVIAVVCGTTASGYCNGKTQKHIYMIAGKNNQTTAGFADAGAADAKFNSPQGIDVETSGNNVNIYIADYANHRLRAYCGFSSGSRCAGGDVGNVKTISGNGSGGSSGDGGAPSNGSAQLNNPADVKINSYGNLFIADFGNHKIRAICYNTNTTSTSYTGFDLCNGVGAAPIMTTLAGTGNQGDAGDFGPASSASITSPIQIAIAKKFADDTNSTFRDNNLIFASKFTNPTGNVVRVICGDNTTVAAGSLAPTLTPEGFCKGNKAKFIYRLAGQSGSKQASGDNSSAQLATLGTLVGITYDGKKNLIAPTQDPDYSLRLISYVANSNVCGLKFSFMDNNQQTSYYCLRYTIQTQCNDSSASCDCAISRYSGNNQDFWTGQSTSDTCP